MADNNIYNLSIKQILSSPLGLASLSLIVFESIFGYLALTNPTGALLYLGLMGSSFIALVGFVIVYGIRKPAWLCGFRNYRGESESTTGISNEEIIQLQADLFRTINDLMEKISQLEIKSVEEKEQLVGILNGLSYNLDKQKVSGKNISQFDLSITMKASLQKITEVIGEINELQANVKNMEQDRQAPVDIQNNYPKFTDSGKLNFRE